MLKRSLFLFLFLIILPSNVFSEKTEEPTPVKGAIHLNSNVSSGEYSPEQLVEMAWENGIEAVFITENLRPRWEYGIFPFRSIVKKVVEKDGLLKYGAEKYSDRVDVIDSKEQEMSVHMVAEVAPFYYWTGDPFDEKGLTLNDWDLQLLVMGIDADDYSGIPTVSNGGFSGYGPRSILMLWPFVLVALGVLALKKKHSRFYLTDSLCWGIILIGMLFALYYYPYKSVKYDQYHGNMGIGPYQDVIDHVNEKGGMTFWSSPEAKTNKDLGQVWFASPSAEKHMMEARDYTGFACFYEGYRKVGGPGGVWDMVLNEYCRGEREKPVWTIGEMAYHGSEASGSKEIDDVQTVFFVPSNTRENVLDAMRSGRMYALRQGRDYELQLDSFAVKYENEVQAGMGEELEASGPVTVNFNIGWKGETGDKITATLVRSGDVISEIIIDHPGEYEFKDDFYEPGKKIYYRLDVRGKYPSMLFTNPIFVKFK